MHVTSTDLGTAGFFLFVCQNILDQPKVEMVTSQGAIHVGYLKFCSIPVWSFWHIVAHTFVFAVLTCKQLTTY